MEFLAFRAKWGSPFSVLVPYFERSAHSPDHLVIRLKFQAQSPGSDPLCSDNVEVSKYLRRGVTFCPRSCRGRPFPRMQWSQDLRPDLQVLALLIWGGLSLSPPTPNQAKSGALALPLFREAAAIQWLIPGTKYLSPDAFWHPSLCPQMDLHVLCHPWLGY